MAQFSCTDLLPLNLLHSEQEFLSFHIKVKRLGVLVYFVISASAGQIQQDGRFCILENHLSYLAGELNFV